jgi:hypothetical protein
MSTLSRRILASVPLKRLAFKSSFNSRNLLLPYLSGRIYSTGNPSIIEEYPTTADSEQVGVKNSSTQEPLSGTVPTQTLLESLEGDGDPSRVDWSKSYHGLSVQPFSAEIAATLTAPVDPMDIEMKPDGLAYLPEIKYRRILNKAFGPGGWGLAPRSNTNVGPKMVSREYALVCLGRCVSLALI